MPCKQQLDSLDKTDTIGGTYKIYPFNPNFLTDYRAYILGLGAEETDRLLAFREEGKYVNSAKEFQQVTKISDSLLAAISPYFKFAEFKGTGKNFVDKKSKERNYEGEKKDINQVNAEELIAINGIGEKLAARILAYRTSLRGFTFDDQVREVYFLPPETADKILRQYEVKAKPEIAKLNVNEAAFKEILALPYIDYALTKRIFNYKKSNPRIDSLEELKKIDSFPLDMFDRIAVYLSTE
ncbi:MAG: helix-hairpin-helix domain-containing protein [Flavobacteriaceae bacterium]|nr:helix-hairpin-helix domain-containing protein [Flavobacteriaceae bacterium]